MAHIAAACKAICVALSSVSRTGGVQLPFFLICPTIHPSSSLPPCLVTRHSLIIYSRMSTAWRWRERSLASRWSGSSASSASWDVAYNHQDGVLSCGCTPPTKGPCSSRVPNHPWLYRWFPKRSFFPGLCLFHSAVVFMSLTLFVGGGDF